MPAQGFAARTLHATCVAIGGKGVLLRGRSGSGKSDLALRLMDAGAALVADDRVQIARRGDRLEARPHERLAGLLEVRGIGIVHVPHRAKALLRLVVDLDVRPARLPRRRTCVIHGVRLPWIALDGHAASAPAKLRLALRAPRTEV